MKDDRRRFIKTVATAGLAASPRLNARPASQKMHAPPVVGGAPDRWPGFLLLPCHQVFALRCEAIASTA